MLAPLPAAKWHTSVFFRVQTLGGVLWATAAFTSPGQVAAGCHLMAWACRCHSLLHTTCIPHHAPRTCVVVGLQPSLQCRRLCCMQAWVLSTSSSLLCCSRLLRVILLPAFLCVILPQKQTALHHACMHPLLLLPVQSRSLTRHQQLILSLHTALRRWGCQMEERVTSACQRHSHCWSSAPLKLHTAGGRCQWSWQTQTWCVMRPVLYCVTLCVMSRHVAPVCC